MLNLLKYEPGDLAEYYLEYGARAQRHLSTSLASDGPGAGIQMSAPVVFTLSAGAPEYDNIVIMQYPSRTAFLSYAQGTARKEQNNSMEDGFVLRMAGLAIQGLVCLGPESDPHAIGDPDGPVLMSNGSAKL